MRKHFLAALAALGLSAAGASASTINVVASLGGTTLATIGCSSGCVGLIEPATTGNGLTSATEALAYTILGPNNPTNITNFLNARISGSLPTGSRDDTKNGDTVSFDSDALWVSFKFANETAFVKNSVGGTQTYTYAVVPGIGSALSDITEFGMAPPSQVVPLPAAGWLLISGMAGLAAAGRRKRRG